MVEQDRATSVDSNPRPAENRGKPVAIPGKGTAKSNTGRASVRMPVEARGLALAILATIAVIFALKWAENFFIPLLLGVFFAYTLNPLVAALERIKMPRAAGA